MIFGRKKSDDLDRLLSTLIPEPALALAKLGQVGKLETTTVEFVFALVAHSQAPELQRLASDAIRIAVSQSAMVVANAGGMLQFAVGEHQDGERLAKALSSALGEAGRVVYGRCRAHVGVVGTSDRKTWTYHPTAMEQILEALLGSQPGEPTRLESV